ncbi:SEFIR domain-containing protein [Longimicrobium sp.]|uniref:SEFIR domain-containing protein n=1 Tax=Longimicrobium sp. TaxID=2029185 RepID=UPI002C2C90F7|nr:SEFIR domain-containing protein [Longimicrobium sp.]HSU15790.1 SEFIR domain-containing protein [Longimicrobium sp.]
MSDPDPQTYPERVLISYSHDSAEHRERVLALAARLRGDGVFVMLDQYDPHPSIGWPQWMRREIAKATHVLVVCTETYLRRVNLDESPDRGLGATWEGTLIILETYASQGHNDKFIPIVFSSAAQPFVPDFLQGATRYDVSSEDGYDALYARLTGQRLVAVPPLGPRRKVGVAAREEGLESPVRPSNAAPIPVATDLMLIEAKETTQFIPVMRIREQGDRVEFTLVPQNADITAFLSELKDRWGKTRVWVAYGDSAHSGSVEAADRVRDSLGERWIVSVVVDEGSRGSSMEIATSGKSADEIAELRARRILLNEKPPADVARWGQVDSMLETLVQGVGAGRSLVESPLLPLYRQHGSNPRLFLAAARLAAVLELRRTETVAHVLELIFQMEDPRRLYVRFRGRRRKIYTNMPAYEMAFEGVCPLS